MANNRNNQAQTGKMLQLIPLVAYLASAIWFSATTVADVRAHSIEIAQLQISVKEDEKSISDVESHISSIDQNVKDVKERLNAQPQMIYMPNGFQQSGNGQVTPQKQ